MIGKVAKYLIGSVKPLNIIAQSTPNGIKITSKTSEINYQISNPMEHLLSTLPACELSTLRALTKGAKLQIKKVAFTKVTSSYQLSNFMAGGPNNHMDDIVLQAQIETNGTQQELDAIHEKVKNSCPIYQTLKGAGINIKSTWKNIQTV